MKHTALARALSMALLAAPAAGEAAAGPPAPAAFEHGDRRGNEVALTFDACTTRARAPYDGRVTAELEAMGVPATIFVGGGWAREEPRALAELSRNPLFEIGNHTDTHPHLTRLPDERIREELLRTQAEIAAVTGRVPVLFRPPYGEYDARVLGVAAGLGLTTVEYDLPSGDPDARATKEALVSWVLRRARPGSIVVMHINHPSFHTAEALPEIVSGLRARGLQLVTVSQLLRAQALGAPPLASVATSASHAWGAWAPTNCTPVRVACGAAALQQTVPRFSAGRGPPSSLTRRACPTSGGRPDQARPQPPSDTDSVVARTLRESGKLTVAGRRTT